ncbi:MAG: single-stranded-DNA-specific exonuclease RecJ [bacterium]
MTTIQQRLLPEAPTDFPETLSALLQRVYVARGVRDGAELSTELSNLLSLDELDGAFAAAELLAGAIQQRQRVLIVGDFDADGATSCALSVLALREMGCHWVNYLVPNRFEYGYGLTPEIVELAAGQQPDWIVTVDNGVSSIAGVEEAKSRGIGVIVTDHHLPGEQLPDADVIVNPNLSDNHFPSKALAGVGVMFYVLLALRRVLREKGWFQQQAIPEPNMAHYLDLVALGTVADVVPLDTNNRILVRQGLERIRGGCCRPGITALLRVAGRNPETVRSSDIGFAVGPRLNAAGRLDDMSIGIECLLAESLNQAQMLAMELDGINSERRRIEQDMKQQALEILSSFEQEDEQDMPWGLCLFNADWHQGVIGILASRVRERYGRPTIIFAPGDHGEIKGSARSIPALHIRDALDEVAKDKPDLLEKFGGHAMAAGMTIAAEKFDEFSEAFDQVVRRRLCESDLMPVILSDGRLEPGSFTLTQAEEIVEAGPWGAAFPEPVFDGWFAVEAQRILKGLHWKLVLRPEGGTASIDAIGFNMVESADSRLPPRIRAAYQLDVNEYRGDRTLQLRLAHIESEKLT